jgi:hypothetical protein
MKCSKRSFAVVSALFTVLLFLSVGTLNARDADLASHAFAAAPTAKQRCIDTCRARYRDCRRLNQVPSFECRAVYRDCTRYTCTGSHRGRRRVLRLDPVRRAAEAAAVETFDLSPEQRSRPVVQERG